MKKLLIETTIKIYTISELPEEYKALEEAVKNIPQQAYAPYSNFHVGAVALLENGKMIAGANQENVAYPSGLCAERVALFSAGTQYPDTPVKAIAIAAETGGKRVERITPCGACRQVMLETQKRSGTPLTILLCGPELVYVIEDAKGLLPLSFEELGIETNSPA